MHRDDRPRARRDHRVESFRLHAPDGGVGVDEDRRRAAVANGIRGRDVGEARHEHLIALAHAGSEQRQVQRGCAVADGDPEPRAAERGELALELGDEAAERADPPGAHRGDDVGELFLAERRLVQRDADIDVAQTPSGWR